MAKNIKITRVSAPQKSRWLPTRATTGFFVTDILVSRQLYERYGAWVTRSTAQSTVAIVWSLTHEWPSDQCKHYVSSTNNPVY